MRFALRFKRMRDRSAFDSRVVVELVALSLTRDAVYLQRIIQSEKSWMRPGPEKLPRTASCLYAYER